MPLTRRTLIRSGLASAGAIALGPGFWRAALAAGPAQPGPGPYGPLGAPDPNGIRLPKGFGARVIASGGLPVPGTLYPWHLLSDGQATYATPDGGWILVSNSEIPAGLGGASAIRFAADGRIVDAYRILADTTSNCSGGKTPWGTWMSCEEFDDGAVWECDPTGNRPARRLPALGLFSHEAVAVDPDGPRLYLTEDDGDGGLYRFTPALYPDCSDGLLEIALVQGDATVRWAPVPEPQGGAAKPTRGQVDGSTKFRRGEGIWFDSGVVYVATTSDDRVHAYDTRSERIEVVYDGKALANPPITDPDNLCVHAPSGDIYCCQDPGSLGIAVITPDRVVAQVVQLDPRQHSDSETTGVVFDPSGKRMYFSSQLGLAGTGVIYEVTGPWRMQRPPSLPAAPPPAAAAGPAIGVEVPRELTIAAALRHGIAIRLTLDRAAPVDAVLRARLTRPGSRRPRTVTLGRVRRRRVGAGPERLTLRLTPAARRLLRARRAGLTVMLTVHVGDRTLAKMVRLTRR